MGSAAVGGDGDDCRDIAVESSQEEVDEEWEGIAAVVMLEEVFVIPQFWRFVPVNA